MIYANPFQKSIMDPDESNEARGAIRTVLFDLDGTLVDHYEAIHAACAHAMRELGLEPADYERVRQTVGGSIPVTMSRLVGAERAPEAVALFRKYFDRNWREGLRPLRGATALLRTLHGRGIQLAVFTNKDGDSARRVCDHLGFTGFLERVMGAGDSPWRKPQPEYTQWALTQLQAQPEHSCLVGDSPWDIEAARTVGMRVYAVPTGSDDAEQLAAHHPTALFDDLVALGIRVFGMPDPLPTTTGS